MTTISEAFQTPKERQERWTSTLDDLRRWAPALANGTLLEPATQDKRLTWVDLAPGIQYGLGIQNANGLVGHNGAIPGFQRAHTARLRRPIAQPAARLWRRADGLELPACYRWSRAPARSGR
jgi:hypothetical protein